jgi:hypothetical protein
LSRRVSIAHRINISCIHINCTVYLYTARAEACGVITSTEVQIGAEESQAETSHFEGEAILTGQFSEADLSHWA